MTEPLRNTTLLVWRLWVGVQLYLCLAPRRTTHAWIAVAGEAAELTRVSATFFIGNTRDRYRRRLFSIIVGRLALHLWCSQSTGDDEIELVA